MSWTKLFSFLLFSSFLLYFNILILSLKSSSLSFKGGLFVLREWGGFLQKGQFLSMVAIFAGSTSSVVGNALLCEWEWLPSEDGLCGWGDCPKWGWLVRVGRGPRGGLGMNCVSGEGAPREILFYELESKPSKYGRCEWGGCTPSHLWLEMIPQEGWLVWVGKVPHWRRVPHGWWFVWIGGGWKVLHRDPLL